MKKITHLMKVAICAFCVFFSVSLIACASGNNEQNTTDTNKDSSGEKVETTETASYEPFIRLDRDDPEAYDKELDNLRFITGNKYEFQDEMRKKYDIAKNSDPDETGLSTLNISASAQFNDWQFHDLAKQLRKVADGKKIYIVDVRREDHALLNGRPFSMYALHNWSNLGMSADEIMADENQRFSSMVGTTIETHPKDDDAPGETYKYDITSFMSEKELVESEDFTYLRLPTQDHSWPDPAEVDQFINLIREVGIDNLWLHIHCHAGKGRTGAFLVMYDKMKNPEVSIEDIATRQALLGGSYILKTEIDDESDAYKTPKYEEKKKMAYLFDQYIDKNKDSNYAVSWSEWLEKHDNAA